MPVESIAYGGLQAANSHMDKIRVFNRSVEPARYCRQNKKITEFLRFFQSRHPGS